MSLRKLIGQWRPLWFAVAVIAFFLLDIGLLSYAKRHPVFQTMAADNRIDKSVVELGRTLDSLKMRFDHPLPQPIDPSLIESLKDLSKQVEQIGATLRTLQTKSGEVSDQDCKRRKH